MEKDHWHLIILKHIYIFVNQIFFTGTGTYGIYRFKDEGKEFFEKKPGLIESKKNTRKTSILRPGFSPDEYDPGLMISFPSSERKESK